MTVICPVCGGLVVNASIDGVDCALCRAWALEIFLGVKH